MAAGLASDDGAAHSEPPRALSGYLRSMTAPPARAVWACAAMGSRRTGGCNR